MARETLHWAPRISAILFIMFISLFALDVFGEGYDFLETMVALFMHLIPSFVLAVATLIGWKSALGGGIAFLAVGILFTVVFHTYRYFSGFLVLSAPLFLIGILFLLDRYLKK